MIYAELDENGLCTNIVVCEDESYARGMGWVGPIDDLDPRPGISWTLMDGLWIPPPEEPVP